MGAWDVASACPSPPSFVAESSDPGPPVDPAFGPARESDDSGRVGAYSEAIPDACIFSFGTELG